MIMWKLEFQINYGHLGYQYVYMNNDGITQMVADGMAKYQRNLSDPAAEESHEFITTAMLEV